MKIDFNKEITIKLAERAKIFPRDNISWPNEPSAKDQLMILNAMNEGVIVTLKILLEEEKIELLKLKGLGK